jgi:hypothetical protein
LPWVGDNALAAYPVPHDKKMGQCAAYQALFRELYFKILTQKLESTMTLYKIDSNLISLGKRAGYFL